MRDVIEQYLRREFRALPHFEQTPSGSLKATIREDECAYGAEFSREFLDEHETAQVESLLREWRLAEEMRRMEGLEVSVSSAGLRLDSSN